MKAAKRSFTLVELLGVMGLIAILAALGFSGYSYAMSSAKDKSTRSTIKRLEAGLEAIKTKQGYYPTTGGEFKVIKIELNNDNSVKKISWGDTEMKVQTSTSSTDSATKTLTAKEKAVKAFLETVSPETLLNSLNGDGELLDAWGTPIYYCYPAKIHSSGFDLISAGPDGKFGKNNNATPVDGMSNYRTKADGVLCDDAMND